ncbi:MAG TPA: ABC transporter permease subunit [Mogibacterium sp.]|nr:ABC transporter permease subunit [Mogibacterium sp.]
MIDFFSYFISHAEQILGFLVEHIQMTAIAVGISMLIGIPLGILISYVRALDKPIIALANLIQAVPSMALLGLVIPLLGIGKLPAIVMVIIYSLLPIIKNTYTGITNIEPLMVESATAIGMTNWQVLQKVKLPLALPVIMAGVRISSVTAVGTMTMAAYIGAGGLGYPIFAGIRTVNNLQILAGAVPACILALLVDFLMGNVERLVTPISLQGDHGDSNGDIKLKNRRRREKISLAGAAIILIIILIANSGLGVKKSDKQISIAGKDFTEQLILCNLYADYIEDKTDITVNRKENLGGSNVAYSAITNGEIDMYIDYTGTIYGSIYNHSGETDMMTVYDMCKEDYAKDGVTLLNQCNCNNTYALAVTPEISEKYNIKTIPDLNRVSHQLVLGSTIEFQNRNDTMVALKDKYNMKFKRMVAIDGSPRFTALVNKETDVTDAWTTDGMLLKFDIIILEDTDQVFPPYYVVPCIRTDALDKYPELENVSNELSPLLTNEVMISLNYQVDVEGKEPADVARNWLKENNLID